MHSAGFALETKKSVERSKKLVARIKSLAGCPDASIIDLMDELSDELCRVADLAECIRQVHPSREVALAAQEASMAINSYVEELNTDTALHRALRNLMDSEQYENLDRVTKRTADMFMHDFEISGIHLEESVRKKVVKLNDHLLEMGYAFSVNASQPTLVHKDECPPALKSHYHKEGDVIHVDHIPYYDHNPQIRKNSYLLYYAQDAHKMSVFEEMVLARRRLAEVVGYPSFAHRQLKMFMSQSPEVAVNFLQMLSDRILPLASDDVETMRQLRAKHGPLFDEKSDVCPWDVPLLVSKAQSQYLSPVTRGVESVKNWFSLESCINGLGGLFRSLFGVSLEVMPVKRGEVWHPSVYKFGFFDSGGHLLGLTYADLLYREGKLASDCHFTIRGGREVTTEGDRDRTSYQLPLIALCCSIKKPADQKPILLSQHAVETLFHEMGHALHSMLGRAKYQNITGTRCSTDFAEVPSTLMEFFLNDDRVLSSFAAHHASGKPLPRAMARRFQLSGHFFAAYDMQVQILNALADQKLHSAVVSSSVIMDTYKETHRQYSPLDYVPETAYFLRFPHLCSYGARYYSYLWSRAVASLIWNSSFKQDPFSRQSGEKLRAMLSVGGGIDPRVLVRDMLGHEPGLEELVNALHCDVLEQREHIKKLMSKNSSL